MLDRIVAETIASPGVEVCGLLLGRGLEVTAVVPCANVAEDPETRFEIDPAALLAAHRATRAGGPAVIGHYHSHPTGRAEPSRRDAADAAADGAVWLVATRDAITAWRAVSHGVLHGRFEALGISILPRQGEVAPEATEGEDSERLVSSPSVSPHGLPPPPGGGG